jgi:outer membrane biosynthesis protein TonB
VAVAAGSGVRKATLSREDIQQVIAAHRAEARNCFERELQQTPELAGRLTLVFGIEPSGRVSRADVKDSTLSSPRVGSCLSAAARRWTFPPTEGKVVTVAYPFVFKPE